MNRKYVKPLTLVLFTLIISFAFSSSVFAASCKGLSKAACSSSSSCSYIKSYTTKSGTKVDSYCRNKPGKKSATSSTKEKSKKVEKKDSKSTKKEEKKKVKETVKKDKN